MRSSVGVSGCTIAIGRGHQACGAADEAKARGLQGETLAMVLQRTRRYVPIAPSEYCARFAGSACVTKSKTRYAKGVACSAD